MRLLFGLFRVRIYNKRFYSDAKKVSDKYFITTPIYYLNSVPHIGHFYTNLLADVSKRWHALQGVHTILSTGTDEHGLKVLKAATNNQQDVFEYCDKLSASFKSLFDLGGISYTSFVRTTDPLHIKMVQRIWQELDSRGCIEKGVYRGWYSVADEAYVPTDQVEEVTDEDGSKNIVCSVTGNQVDWTEEENLMFHLSHFSEPLLKWLNSGAIQPTHHLEPIKQWIKSGLPPLSLSRHTDKNPWGIPVPGNPQQNVYVWLDALVNYLTVSQQLDCWPPDCQVVGKDIIKFHAVYWPAFLMALDLPLPRKVLCHGHWMVDRTKMSKSRGNVVDPVARMNMWSSDALRYYLLKESSIASDCDYSDQRAVECINADLVNTFGNLLSRSTGKSLNPSQTFPPMDSSTHHRLCSEFKNTDPLASLYALADSVDVHYRNFENNKVLEAVMSHLYAANAFFQHSEPWKKNPGEVRAVLHVGMEVVRVCSLALSPIIPTLANKALDRLNIPLKQRSFKHMKQPIDQLRGTDCRLGADTGVLLKRIKFEEIEMKKTRPIKQ